MVTKSRKNSKQFNHVLCLPKGVPRPCRDFMARTTLVVQRASSSVRRLCSVSLPTFCPQRIHTCSDLLKQVKEFLSQDLGLSEETQMAFQSIKKLLPNSCACLKHSMLADLHSRLSRPPPSLPKDYIRFAREISSEIFAKGWDASWDSKVKSFSPSLGSCIGSSRKNGGQLSSLAAAGQLAWQDSLMKPLPGSLEGELLLVDSSGKPRPLTRFGPEAASLRPLHGLIYDQLSKFKWLLRGDVCAEQLEKAGFDFGKSSEEPLTSGDYKSASDNLSIEVAEAILDVAWSKSSHVPSNVFRYALAAQRPRLAYETEDLLLEHFVPTRGQMMGSYLCFPLLCLQNYIAFRYAEKVMGLVGTPVLINGDDILFQSSWDFSKFWMSVVGGLGLEVERTKTSVSCEFGSLNSTLVRWKGGNLIVVRTLRLGMLRECSHPGNLGDSCNLFSRVGVRTTWLKNACEFLSWHARTIVKWNATLLDMGFRGRLLKRAFSLFRGGRLLWRDDVLHMMGIPRLPAAHNPHNIVMSGSEFVNVPLSSVSKEMDKEIRIWMSSRKWELGKEFKSIKPVKAVAERAYATQVPAYLNRYDTPVRRLKEESDRVLRRTEYYSTDISWRPSGKLRNLWVNTSGYKFLYSTKREVGLERSWWRDRVKVKEKRVPKDIWYAENPPLHINGGVGHTSTLRHDVVAELVMSVPGEEGDFFYSGIAGAMLSNPVTRFFRQFWEMIE